jgi:hypothetical protein
MANVSYQALDNNSEPRAWRAADGVGFRLRVGSERFECRVTSEVLAGFEFAANDDFDWVDTYLKHSDRIDDVARGLIALGLRGPRLAVRLQHFMD